MAAVGLSRTTTRLLNSRLPVIVVCGATGTGKSKLALELAVKYGGEIISADSMQIYQGLDIITNKVTLEERQLVPHHLIDCASPLTRWTVVDFQRKSLAVIDDLLLNGRVPVIVGGTHYYIESLLWKVLLDGDHKSGQDQTTLLYERDEQLRRQRPSTSTQTAQTLDDGNDNDELLLKLLPLGEVGSDAKALEHLSSARLHQLLRKVDPVMADTIHPNNRRKIFRSLQAWQQHGRPHSELLRSQRDSEGGSTLGGPLRYDADRTLIFWVQCQQEVLDRRLDARVDDMMSRGLVAELAHFHHLYNERRLQDEKIKEADYTIGIFQSIGLKEFHEFLVLPSSEQTTQTGRRLLDQGVEALKSRTRRYARKQTKWIVKRFLEQPDRQVPPVYGLDATDVTEWNEKVRDVAFRIVDSFGSDEEQTGDGSECRPKPLAVAETTTREEQTSFHCPLCEKVTVGQRQWQEHLGSNRHRKLVKRAATNGDGLDQQSKPRRRQPRSAKTDRADEDETNAGGSQEAALTSAQAAQEEQQQQPQLPSLQIDQQTS
ncbi:tRNA dimethylallyltransferase-like [Daphnia pulex]|uniref:tRNA dimethylallyltransferase-like n=1 Tax=Daphnia pulex TaxID=6669 RepID=UPI001EE1073F|nr:tRNA dimethylallyltransferase-like [Daphnia pulex]